eukprot:7012007-Pyramimonas_sp.AAC.1
MDPKEPLGCWVEPAMRLLKKTPLEPEDINSDLEAPETPRPRTWSSTYNEAARLRTVVGGG